MVETTYVVVIVTYNRKRLLHECIRCVEKQTIPAKKVIIVNNASTDGTTEYLGQFSGDEKYIIINSDRNIGGAGGFERGIGEAVRQDADWVLVIDDDAMLTPDYTEKLLEGKKKYGNYRAIAGSVKVNGIVDPNHRKRVKKPGLLLRNVEKEDYQKGYFICDNASFCGLMVEKDLLTRIGLPHGEYFIWHDDTEYSMRIREHSPILVVPEAVLDHKTELVLEEKPRRYTWKDYYGIRNRIWYVKEHGNLVDKVINRADLFIHVIFRNWLYSVIRKSGHDWRNELDITWKALKDAKKER